MVYILRGLKWLYHFFNPIFSLLRISPKGINTMVQNSSTLLEHSYIIYMYGAIVKITFSRIFNAMVNGNDFKAKKKSIYSSVHME